MADRPLRVMQVSLSDVFGGAERVAWSLFRSLRERGCDSWMAVGRKLGDDPDVLQIPDGELRRGWYHFWRGAGVRLKKTRVVWRFGTAAESLAEPARMFDKYCGFEDAFRFPGAWGLLDLPPHPPDVIHCHTLHGKYFDLRALPWLSRQVPLVITLHDPWLMSGHCSHSFDCERWKTGCGRCPDLALHQSIRRDSTRYNWRRKQKIYRRSQLHIATPCRWMMRRVEESMLGPAAVETRVIPYGVDLDIFGPFDRQEARAALGIPPGARVLLFAANGIRQYPAKDFKTMRDAVALLGERLASHDLLFLALGEEAPAEQVGRAAVRFVPFEKDPAVVARYYQAADIYLHAARVDTFPNAVLEALACGTPVVATAVGGIPEQVKSIAAGAGWEAHDPSEATGCLVPQRDAEAIAIHVERLLDDASLYRRLCENAAGDARARFDLQRQVDDYLEWYGELLGKGPRS